MHLATNQVIGSDDKSAKRAVNVGLMLCEPRPKAGILVRQFSGLDIPHGEFLDQDMGRAQNQSSSISWSKLLIDGGDRRLVAVSG